MPNMRCHTNLHRHWQLDTFCTAQQTFWITSHTWSDDTAAEVPWYTAQPLLKARSALIMVLLCDKHLTIVRHLCTGAIAVGIATRSQHTATFMHNVVYATPHMQVQLNGCCTSLTMPDAVIPLHNPTNHLEDRKLLSLSSNCGIECTPPAAPMHDMQRPITVRLLWSTALPCLKGSQFSVASASKAGCKACRPARFTQIGTCHAHSTPHYAPSNAYCSTCSTQQRTHTACSSLSDACTKRCASSMSRANKNQGPQICSHNRTGSSLAYARWVAAYHTCQLCIDVDTAHRRTAAAPH